MRGLVLDVRELLRPIPGTQGGAGNDLRSDYAQAAPYHWLRTARSDARAAERANNDAADFRARMAVPGAWHAVVEASLACFAHCRDFEVACWLTEALTRLHGVSGLAMGADLLSGLCDRYWGAGYLEALPLAEVQAGEEWEDREVPITGLFGGHALGMAMRPLWLRPLYDAEDGPVSLHDLCRALGVPAYRELDRARPRAVWADACHCSPAARSAIAALAQDVPMLVTACQALDARLARRLPRATDVIMLRVLAFAEAVEDVAEIVAAQGASPRLYC